MPVAVEYIDCGRRFTVTTVSLFDFLLPPIVLIQIISFGLRVFCRPFLLFCSVHFGLVVRVKKHE